jgi:hypothetical protein
MRGGTEFGMTGIEILAEFQASCNVAACQNSEN